MADLTLTLDPTSENASNVPFELVSDAAGATLVSQAYPAPPPVVSWASSADSEGDRLVSQRFGNRVITLEVELTGATVRTKLNALQQKVQKIGREGGTLKHLFPDTSYVVFDLITWQGYEPVLDITYFAGNLAAVKLEFAAKPFARGVPVTLTDHIETTLPVLIFTETGILGDAPALGRLIVDEDQGAIQQWAVWGLQRDTYDSAATAALFYEAESRTPQSGATIVTQTGASGGGTNNAIEGTLTTSYSSLLSTQAASAGAHLSHTGTYRVFARVLPPAANTGQVSVALEWGQGDFRRYTRNTAQVIPAALWNNTHRLVDLGLITIEKVPVGTQRWEGRILAKSTIAGDKLRLDHLVFIPVEKSGETQGVSSSTAAPSALSARDEFDQAAGAATGKTLPIGGTWGGAGDADDFVIGTSSVHSLSRTAVSDTAGIQNGRLLTASTPSLTDTLVKVDVDHSTTTAVQAAYGGVLARYVDASNFLTAYYSYLDFNGALSQSKLTVGKVIAGTFTPLGWLYLKKRSVVTVRLTVVGSDFLAEVLDTSGGVVGSFSGNDPALLGGGTLATGKVGIVDNYTSATARGTLGALYDNFAAWIPQADAAVFGSRSLEWRDNGVLRTDSAGTFYQPPSKYEGDYLLIPPYGQEAKPSRFIVKLSRSIPGVGPDSSIDDLSARLTVTPRYLVVPD